MHEGTILMRFNGLLAEGHDTSCPCGMIPLRILRAILTAFLCAATVTGGARAAHAQQAGTPGAWNKVWKSLQAPPPVPAAAKEVGPPVREGGRVLFRFRAPAGTTEVYLAGSFNAWAHNNEGIITDRRFAMRPAGGGLWYQWVELSPQVHHYKYVAVTNSGKPQWGTDPLVPEVGEDGNTLLDFSAIARIDTSPPSDRKPRRALKPSQPGRTERATGHSAPSPSQDLPNALDVRCDQVWVRPDRANSLVVRLGPEGSLPGVRLDLSVLTPFGESVYRASRKGGPGENRLTIPALHREGGFLARVTVSRAGRALRQGETVLSVVQNVADDLRYGFYANYGAPAPDYDAKADMLARLHVNAVEFYDYFPAHGYYAPREADYRFEPFGVAINARDVRRKIDAGHRRNILSLAYVAAYAASESVYRAHPDPMTDENGVPKVFNGSVMTEAEADRRKQPKWFWLMDVSAGSAWHDYILGELGRALDDGPDDLVSFDGFEVDTYGDSPGARFYAKGSRRSGDLLSDVLHDYVGDVHALTHKIKPHGLASFNSVNGFGVEKIGDVTDFLFLEIWDFYRPTLEGIVDVCARSRAARRQRVILKLYPATMRPGHKSWPAATLRRLLGATMTGAGSLMVAGEPDAGGGGVHALNTLYYPDNQPLSAASERLLRDYYRFDALMYGWTHGRNVVNTPLDNPIPGCLTRTYAAPCRKALVVQVLNVGNERNWTVDAPEGTPRRDLEVALDLPGGVAPKAVYFASPDVPALQTPVRVDFDAQGGKLRTLLPELRVHGTLVLQY